MSAGFSHNSPREVTDALRAEPIDAEARYYLCGNCDMIYEAVDILQDAGVPHANLFAEVYF
jgi:ferredoxin--NADP+ reductase